MARRGRVSLCRSIYGLRAAHWIRESTRGQYDNYGPEAQREQQDRAIERWALVDTHIEWEVAHSGRTVGSTLQFREMVARAGQDYDVLLVGYVSRFARNLRTAVNARHDLHEAGAAVLTRQDPQPPVANPNEDPGRWDDRIIRIACRYLNSGIPVLVGTSDHAFVLCGYRRVPRPGTSDWITFIRQDDQWGPYREVSSVFQDADPAGNEYAPWQLMIAPLPDKLWLPAEPAEGAGGVRLEEFASRVSPLVPEARGLLDLISSGRLTLRTYSAPSNQWKVELEGRVAPDLVREYRTARFSRYIWVVEAIDRDARAAGLDCVVGEAIFDATSSDSDPNPLALRVPGVAFVARTDGSARFPIRCSTAPYRSGGVGAA